MRIPHEIDRNTIEAYAVPACIIRNQKLRLEDFTWDSKFQPSLRELSLQAIAKHWERNPLYKELVLLQDRSRLLEILSTDLPFELTVPLLDEEYYWKRCYLERWPDISPPSKRVKYETIVSVPIKIEPDFERRKSVAKKEVSFLQDTPAADKKKTPQPSTAEFKPHERDFPALMECKIASAGQSNVQLGLYDICLNYTFVKKTWKQCFIERYVAKELERMAPMIYNPDHIKELTDLFGPYIKFLKVNELRQCKHEESTDHISLYTLLSNLPELIEFSVCFTQMNLGDNFTWHARQISTADCKFLGQGVAKTNLEILRVVRSDINCEKIKYILQPIVEHPTLRVLDFSHCKIGDEGAKAIAAMLTKTPNITSLIMVDNQIGPKGAHGIGYYLCQPECRLMRLNLKLNPLGIEGGMNILTALARGAKTVQYLSLAACSFSEELIHLGKALAFASSLIHLDLSNNNFGSSIGDDILTVMRKNETMTRFDLRMCGIPATTLKEIDAICRHNLLLVRPISKYPPYTQDII